MLGPVGWGSEWGLLGGCLGLKHSRLRGPGGVAWSEAPWDWACRCWGRGLAWQGAEP